MIEENRDIKVIKDILSTYDSSVDKINKKDYLKNNVNILIKNNILKVRSTKEVDLSVNDSISEEHYKIFINST